MNKREYRTYEFELRKAGDGQPKIIGYSAVFDQLSGDLGGFKEKIQKGAFAKSITEDDIRALFNHDSNYVIGRNKNGTLKLEEDDHGLKVEIDPPDTQFANDLVKQIERGDINQMSFGFVTRSDKWEEKENQLPIRTLLDVELWDVSPVTFPAFPQTNVGVHSAEEIYKEYRKSQKPEPPKRKIIDTLRLKQKLIEK
ncbi:MAG: HK97 family phage prohead protease [Candidatus Omnitrophica bacterium]|nr:HK97 family phage prohead protease [Candidatus Omnitrophota bacterium]